MAKSPQLSPSVHPAPSRNPIVDMTMDGRLTGIALTQSYLSASLDDLDLRNSLDRFAQALTAGDMSQVECMLASQAVALQGMFTDLALRAKKASALQAQQILTQLALKVQSNSRATLEALITAKQPRQVAFVRQANVAHTQQVNNGVMPSHAGNVPTASNKLIAEDVHGGQTVERRATKAAGAAHSRDPALAPVHWSKKR